MTVPIPESKRRNNDIYNAKCDRICVQDADNPLQKPPGRASRRMCSKPAPSA